jgi:uncharacterized protein with HEPN domain
LLSLYVEDAIEAIEKIQKFTRSLSSSEFESNDLVKDAVIRNFEVIGEACKKIPDPIRIQFDQIPWKSIIGLRNSLLHEYLGIDYSILYEITTNELQETKRNLQKCLIYLQSKQL